MGYRNGIKLGEVRAEAEIAQESSSKRACTELEQEKEVAIDAIPLATKPPSIVDYKIHKEGKKTYYQIIRADGSSKMYLVFSHILKSFDKEDLETLWKLVKAKHGSTRPEEGYERVAIGLYDSCRPVGILRLYDDLEITAAKLMLLVYKLLLLVLEVNAASTKVTTAQRLRLLKEFLLSRDG
ncbi:hypothetical protein Tco_1175587 [Tanacetum coccineum]